MLRRELAMNVLTIIGVLVGAVGGYLVCQFHLGRQFSTALAAMERDLEFETSLVRQLQERSATYIGAQRHVLRHVEQGHLEHVRSCLASAVAAYYQSWKGNSEQRLTPAVAQDLAAIERDAESVPSLQAALRRPSADHPTSD